MSEKITLIINSTHKTDDNTYIYKLPNNVNFSYKDTIGLESLSMYNSFFNISTENNNKSINFIWNADSSTTYTLNLRDGFYTIDDLNYAIQNFCVINNLYSITSNGKFVYYISIIADTIGYGCALRCDALHSFSQASTLGYTKPTEATWNYPTLSKTVQINILTQQFGNLIGFNSGIYPSSVQSIDQVFSSSKTPQIAVINSLILTCSLLSSKITLPNNILSSIPIDVAFGSMMKYNAPEVSNLTINAGTYNEIRIQFLDQKFKKVNIIDDEIVLRLSITLNK